MRYTQRLIALIGIIVLVAGVLPLATPSLAGPNDAPIRLRVATFRPGLGEKPNIPARLTATEPGPGEQGYYLVQFAGPIQSAWKDALTRLGVEVLEYIPEFAFKVRMTPEMAEQVRRLDNVVWLDLFHPAYKLNPDLLRDRQRLYTVRLEQGVDADAVANLVASKGPQVFSRNRSYLLVAAVPTQLETIALIRDVAWIDNYSLRHKENEYGAGVIMGSNEANARGYDGSTQIVAVADTGLGGGTPSTAHRDIPASRIVAIHDWPGGDYRRCYDSINDGARDVDSGHGTHTSGSVLSGGGPNGEGRGTAPAARLVFQAVEDYVDFYGFCSSLYSDGYYLFGLPDDIRDLFQQAYNDGARIHSNSWGSDVAGEYTDDAANTDNFMWSHPDMLVTTSAGNAGIDSNSDGYVDLDSMGSPATAKNILTVGASEHDRQGHYECDANLTYTNPDGDSCNSLGGMNQIFTYGEAWPSDFPANPIAGDLSAGNPEQMVAFSSRGPTDDGRIKPDVIASGTWVLSAYSDLYQEGYDPSRNPQNNAWQYDGWGFPLNQYYKYMGGTSMSNPLAAGAAAVVRDYYQKAYSHSASAALTKATLINSAVDILDENNDGANDNDYPIPNNHEGWGRVHVGNATDGSYQFVDQATGLGTGGSAVYQYNVSTGDNPFKVTLVWTDYPGSTSASKALVNDLDLVVTAPNGSTTYRGNVFSGGWSQTGGSADRTNNVENVYVQSAASGTWTVQVSGYNVPNGPQPFALVVDGSFGAPPPTPTNTPVPPTPTNTPVPPTPTNTPVPPTPTNTPVPPTPTNTPVPPTPTNTPVPPTPTNTPVPPTPTNTPVPPTPTNTPLPPTPTNTPMPPTPTNTPTITPTPGSATMHVGDLDRSSAWVFGSWLWQATVTIEVHNASHNPVANATVNATWSGGYSGSGQCTTASNGRCSISSGYIWRNNTSTTFTVNNVTHATLTYNPTANHDPDGDSNGTAITVNRP